ncbi:MAG: peptidoglycan-associated lipoprotein Pal [Gammaproteobacteria bacterium]|nr:peptidoglycan-associated lipoprotein Pal [Gammaproteobacteria bacterium]
MKKLHLLVVVLFSFSVLGGCSSFKSKRGSVQDGTQTSGLGDQDSFGEYGFSDANRLKAPYNQSYRFGFDKYSVNQEDIESINVQANYLIAHPSAKVRLEGNADERGSREYNIALGWKRAKAVAEVLKQQGVSNAQIVMISYGKEKPIAFGHDEDAHSQNRRTDLIYESK